MYHNIKKELQEGVVTVQIGQPTIHVTMHIK